MKRSSIHRRFKSCRWNDFRNGREGFDLPIHPWCLNGSKLFGLLSASLPPGVRRRVLASSFSNLDGKNQFVWRNVMFIILVCALNENCTIHLNIRNCRATFIISRMTDLSERK